MKEAQETTDEADRLAKLQSYRVLDTSPEKLFDDITHIASHICGTPISLVSLVDADRQWFKSKKGLDVEQTSRSVAFCAHAIHSDELLYVPDATKDERFHDNPLVTESPNLMFYAGAPIVTPEGHKVGTLCVLDNKPNELSIEQRSILTRLSNQVSSNLELRLNIEKLNNANDELAQFAYRTSHDLKSPITTSLRLLEYLDIDIDDGNFDEAKLNVSRVRGIMLRLDSLVQDILSLVRAESDPTEEKLLNVAEIVENVVNGLERLAHEHGCEIITSIDKSIDVRIQRGRLTQIIENLISNGIKYSDRSTTNSYVKIGVSKTDSELTISIRDNGVGIPEKFHDDIYKAFTRFHPESSFGSGLGMSIVKKHIDYLNGKVEFSSSASGTSYEIVIPLISKDASHG